MDKDGVLFIVCSYIKDRFKPIILLLVCSCIFAAVFYLYRLPVEASGYGALLCVCLILCIAIYDCIVYCKRHALLRRIMKTASISLDGLPPPKSLTERDDQRLIAALFNQISRDAASYDIEKNRLRDYYDLWAHQVKIPIAALMLLLEDDVCDKNAMWGELFKIQQYVNMALHYTRLDSVSTDYVIQSQVIDPIIRQAVRKYARLFIQKNISIDYGKIDIEAVTDSKWLGFVIEQVLSNAVKYTPAGGCVRIFTRGDDELVIEDTGMGIPSADLIRIFEKGYTGINGRIDKNATGLGLYLSKRVTNNLSHALYAESEIHKGAAFVIGFKIKGR